jgi:hypothetical protein
MLPIAKLRGSGIERARAGARSTLRRSWHWLAARGLPLFVAGAWLFALLALVNASSGVSRTKAARAPGVMLVTVETTPPPPIAEPPATAEPPVVAEPPRDTCEPDWLNSKQPGPGWVWGRTLQTNRVCKHYMPTCGGVR